MTLELAFAENRFGEHAPVWPWGWLTAEVAPIAARWKVRPEDFAVEEVLAEELSDEGDHVYVRIEKVGITTVEAVRRLARVLETSPRDVGMAGLKDAGAVARQTLSFEHLTEARIADLDSLELSDLRVLSWRRHRRKLKRGRLRGNRFFVRLRDVPEDRAADVERVCARLVADGLPNFFGLQRFGARGDNAALAAALLSGDADEAVARWIGRPQAWESSLLREARDDADRDDWEAAAAKWPSALADGKRLVSLLAGGATKSQALRRLPRPAKRFLVSALQSWLFNDVLAARLDQCGSLLEGDLVFDHGSERVRPVRLSPDVVSDVSADVRADAGHLDPDPLRAARFELSPTGPLAGRELRSPTGEALRVEQSALAPHESSVAALARPGPLSWPGSRRPLRAPVSELTHGFASDVHGVALELRFFLPAGSYASGVVGEFAKDLLRTG